MEVNIENRHHRCRRSRNCICSSSRSGRSPRDIGLSTGQSYRASSCRRNHSERRDLTDLHEGATSSGEPTARFSCGYLPGNCPPRADQDCPSRPRRGHHNPARRLLGQQRLLFRQPAKRPGTLSHGSCVPKGSRGTATAPSFDMSIFPSNTPSWMSAHKTSLLFFEEPAFAWIECETWKHGYSATLSSLQRWQERFMKTTATRASWRRMPKPRLRYELPGYFSGSSLKLLARTASVLGPCMYEL